MQKGAGPVRTEAVLLHVRNRYVPGAYGVAPVRCTPHCGRAGARPSQGITAPKEHPPRVRKRPPGCRKVLAPFAPRRCSYTYETATFRVHMAQRRCAAPRMADEPVLVPLRASPRRRSSRPGCENVLTPFAPRRCSYTHETTTFRVHMAQRGCATPRIADELVLVPLRASPRRRSTRPRCENVLAPFAPRRCSYTYAPWERRAPAR